MLTSTTKVRRQAVAVVAIALTVAGGVSADAEPTPTPSSDWVQSAADGAHTYANLAPSDLTVSTVARARATWRHRDAFGFTGPLVRGAVVYYAFASHPEGSGPVDGVRAVRLGDGKALWSVVLRHGPGQQVSASRALAVRGHLLYAVGSGGRSPAGVTAIDLRSHRVAWTARVSPSPAAGLDNTDVYGFSLDADLLHVLADDGSLDTFDARTGRRLWTKRGGYGGRATVLAAHGTVFYARPGAGFAAYDGRTGRVRWTTADQASSATVVAGYLVVADRQAVRAYRATGCGQTECEPSWIASSGGDFSLGTVSGGADGTLSVGYSGGAGSVVETRDVGTGRLRWRSVVGHELMQQPIVRSGSTLFAFVDNRLTAFPVRCSTTCSRQVTVPAIRQSGYSPGAQMTAGRDHLLVQDFPDTVTAFARRGAAALNQVPQKVR